MLKSFTDTTHTFNALELCVIEKGGRAALLYVCISV